MDDTSPHRIERRALGEKQRRWWNSLSDEEKDLFIDLAWDIDGKAFGICYSKGKYMRLYDKEHKAFSYGTDKEQNA